MYPLALVLLLSVVDSAPAAPLFTRTETFRPLRMSHVELLAVTGRLRALLGPDQSTDIISITFESRGRTTEFAQWPTAASLTALPDSCDGIIFTFDRPGAPVSKVTLQLGDYARTLRVHGRSEAQVEAAGSLMKSDLSGFSTVFGGSNLRLFAGMLLAIPAGFFLGWFGAQSALWQSSPERRIVDLVRPAVLSAFLYSVLLLPPWSAWLPGTSLLRGTPSLLARYSPELSLVGIVLTTFFGVREWLRTRRTRTAA